MESDRIMKSKLMRTDSNTTNFLCHHFGYYFCEELYGLYLKLTRDKKKDPLITEKDIEKINSIAKKAYKNTEFQQENKYLSIRELLADCFCNYVEQVYCFLEEDWFLLLSLHHNHAFLVEFAGVNGRCANIFQAVDYLKKKCRGKKIITICNEDYSYPLIKLLEKSRRIEIVYDVPRKRKNGEKIHEIQLFMKME